MTATGRKVGILGSGDVGQALGRGFQRHGFDVMVGSRSPGKLDAWRQETGGRTGTFAEAARHGDVLILATAGAGVEHAIELAGATNFRGKLVLDATNPLDFTNGMPPGLFVGTTDSLGERVQRKVPLARVVKCFNTVSNPQMVDPKFRQGTPPMLICGDDAGAKKETEALLLELGWPGVRDMGGIDGARWLEALVPLWVRAGAALDTWNHAWTIVE